MSLRMTLFFIASCLLLICAGVIAVSLDTSLLAALDAHLDISDTLMGGLFVALGAAALSYI